MSSANNVIGRAGSAHAAVLPLPPQTLREDGGEIPSRGRLGEACVVRDLLCGSRPAMKHDHGRMRTSPGWQDDGRSRAVFR
jgi:hypothetical protein